MEKLLRGILKYRKTSLKLMVQELQDDRNDPEPSAVFVSCVGSRIIPHRLTDSTIGGIYIVRNPGNLIPHSQFTKTSVINEPAALELCCLKGYCQHIIILGHSKCSSMAELLKLQDETYASEKNRQLSPFRSWVYTYAMSSLRTFQQLKQSDFKEPMVLEIAAPKGKLTAYIDKDNVYSEQDKLSQISCLQQIQNVASYDFLQEVLDEKKLFIHALWLDNDSGEIYYFSKKQKMYVQVNEASLNALLEEIELMTCNCKKIK